MKKLLAIMLALVMVVSLFAGCGDSDTNPTTGNDPTNAPTTGNNPTEGNDPTTAPTEGGDVLVSPYPKELAAAEEITVEPLYYLSFEDDTNLTPMEQVTKAEGSLNDGATYDLAVADKNILHSNGVKGSCIYLDGTYGVKLENLVETSGDAYTISFWVNTTTIADYMPSLQIGRNIADAGDDKTVAWINVTSVNFFGTGSNFPTIWNRNSSFGPDADGDGVNDGVWPWINMLDDQVHGKKEWVMVTIVATGEQYQYLNVDTGLYEERIGVYYYLNGVEVMNGTADGVTTLAAVSDYHGLSPEILKGDGLEGYLGINYWDLCMRAYFDELYIYDYALTAGQVATLWADGDATVETVKPEDSAKEETAPVDTNAIDVAGTPNMLTGWWADWTKGFELKDGTPVTVQLNNYSLGGANWNNYCTVFCNVPTPGHAAPAETEGYAEYAVVRADLFGWGDASYAMTTAECSWLTGAAETVDAEWAAWLASMKDADVTLVITRNGSEITIEATQVCADGNTYTSKMVVASTLTAEAPCYFFFVTDTDYIEVLSVQ